MERAVSQAVRLGGGQYRRDAHVLSAAPATSQAFEVDEYAGANQPGTEAAHAGGAHLSECGELFATDSSLGGGDSRGLDRGGPVSEHGGTERTSERTTKGNGAGGLRKKLSAPGGAEIPRPSDA